VQNAEAIIVVVPKGIVDVEIMGDAEVDVEATKLYHYHCIDIIK
jgi:hypothetical protein